MIGKKLIELRTEQNITQNELAKALNVSRQVVSQWEHDKRDPDLHTLKMIAKFFQCPTDEILDFEI